ncbi:Signal transduction histidine kinase CheA [hydrothermal vent metagenome]|uniref:histidine kinase n=1 Tax=hydrothermal vent metagenome TaxID=652676 RepID=A0A3B0Y5D3_9ZZZZ
MSVSISEDDEILQDFLVEAGEILELLGEQLVELEKNPEDDELLNAVFRGFHTVKGGAGFLDIQPMIEICHRAEDVFNVLRQGERKICPDLMDTVLKVVDILNEQFEQLNDGQSLTSAEQNLLDRLASFAKADTAEVVADTPAIDNGSDAASLIEQSVTEEPVAAKPEQLNDKPDGSAPVLSESDSGEITDSEFDALLDALDASGTPPSKGSAEVTADESGVKPESTAESDSDLFSESTTAIDLGSDDISEDEFQAMLDDIHGEAGVNKPDEVPKTPAAPATTTPSQETKADVSPASSDSESQITEDQFDHLLDALHGEGKINTSDMDEKKKVNPGEVLEKAASKEKIEKKEEAVTAVAAQKQVRSSEATVRVDTKRLDQIMNMVGELVLVRNRLDTLKIKLNDEDVTKAVSNLDIVTSDLQASVMKTRMQPIKKVFGRFPRVVRDLARGLKKEVALELMGEETDLDKNLVEALADPMVHLVRNSVDHGVEMPDDREKAGKKRCGTIVLSAAQEGDHILLIIEDDGAGMDAGKLKNIAIEKGVLDKESAAHMEDREAFNLIFAPGFSTKSEISDISGRGVGMDVVKTRISQLNGTIDIDSTLGKGTRISVKLPLTLAILPTLMVKVGDRTFALPLSSVNEIFSIESYTTNIVDGQLVIMVRNKAMPLFYLNKWLTAAGASMTDPSDNDQVVVANVGNRKVGFVVNQVVGQEEVVIKPLGTMLHGLPGFAGATITGDGRIALILDIPSLMRARTSGM